MELNGIKVDYGNLCSGLHFFSHHFLRLLKKEARFDYILKQYVLLPMQDYKCCIREDTLVKDILRLLTELRNISLDFTNALDCPLLPTQSWQRHPLTCLIFLVSPTSSTLGIPNKTIKCKTNLICVQ